MITAIVQREREPVIIIQKHRIEKRINKHYTICFIIYIPVFEPLKEKYQLVAIVLRFGGKFTGDALVDIGAFSLQLHEPRFCTRRYDSRLNGREHIRDRFLVILLPGFQGIKRGAIAFLIFSNLVGDLVYKIIRINEFDKCINDKLLDPVF
jgi:hypothetical protein